MPVLTSKGIIPFKVLIGGALKFDHFSNDKEVQIPITSELLFGVTEKGQERIIEPQEPKEAGIFITNATIRNFFKEMATAEFTFSVLRSGEVTSSSKTEATVDDFLMSMYRKNSRTWLDITVQLLGIDQSNKVVVMSTMNKKFGVVQLRAGFDINKGVITLKCVPLFAVGFHRKEEKDSKLTITLSEVAAYETAVMFRSGIFRFIPSEAALPQGQVRRLVTLEGQNSLFGILVFMLSKRNINVVIPDNIYVKKESHTSARELVGKNLLQVFSEYVPGNAVVKDGNSYRNVGVSIHDDKVEILPLTASGAVQVGLQLSLSKARTLRYGFSDSGDLMDRIFDVKLEMQNFFGVPSEIRSNGKTIFSVDDRNVKQTGVQDGAKSVLGGMNIYQLLSIMMLRNVEIEVLGQEFSIGDRIIVDSLIKKSIFNPHKQLETQVDQFFSGGILVVIGVIHEIGIGTGWKTKLRCVYVPKGDDKFLAIDDPAQIQDITQNYTPYFRSPLF
jgi:hypothetical protein